MRFVSISRFRNNIAAYIEKVLQRSRVFISNDKRGRAVTELTKSSDDFDPEAFGKALKAAARVFTGRNHPEWKTKKDVIRWVREGRKVADRTF